MENNALKIRVVADTEEDIFIDLVATRSSNLLSIHNLLVKTFELDSNEIASFYLSNNNWDKGDEITLFNMSLEEEKDNDGSIQKSMENTSLENLFSDGISKLLYLHDFLNMNIFYVELLNEETLNSNESLQVTHQLGKYAAKKFDDDSNFEEIDPVKDILDEYDEDNFGDFEELDEDLY
jgi:hypothetical protein